VTESVFARDGDVAPLVDLCEAAKRGRARLIVDESRGIGCLGPDGRGAVAEAGLDGEADLVLSSLGTALGSYGGVIAGAPALVAEVAGASPIAASAAPTPPASAAALAALDLLGEGPRRVAKLQGNAGILRDALAEHGMRVTGSDSHVMALAAGGSAGAARFCAAALEEGVLVEAVAPPEHGDGGARVRMAVMATHTRAELVGAARALERALGRAGLPDGDVITPSGADVPEQRIFDVDARLAA
jgi:7-keto-8-aminopelargonate synthetase-like enzyme